MPGAVPTTRQTPVTVAYAHDAWPETVPAMEVARRWAVEEGWRSGDSVSVRVTALLPVVGAWAVTHGFDAPGARSVGLGLSAAGVHTKTTRAHQRLYLRRADAARLKRLVYEAWAPRLPPGEKPSTRAARAPLRTRLERLARMLPTPEEVAAGTFHGELKGVGKRRPVCDHLGHCWPSLRLAEAACTPKYLRKRRKHPGGTLLNALKAGRPWQGRLWRYMLPGEVAAVPAGAPCGVRLEACSWATTQAAIMQLTLSQMGVYGSGAVARDDDREG